MLSFISTVPSYFHNEWFYSIFAPLLGWICASLFLYGYVGPERWRTQAKQYAEDPYGALTFVQFTIWFVEGAVPLAVLAWLLLHRVTTAQLIISVIELAIPAFVSAWSGAHH